MVPTSKPPSTTGPSGLIIATASTNKTGNSTSAQSFSRSAAPSRDIDTRVPYSGHVFSAQDSGFRRESDAHFPHDRASFADGIHAKSREHKREQPPPMNGPMITFPGRSAKSKSRCDGSPRMRL